MKTGRTFFTGMSMLFPELTLLCCILYFPLLARKIEYISLNLPLWLGVTAAGFLINLFLRKGGGAWKRIFIWNLAWAVCTALAGFHGTSAPGPVPGVAAAVFLIAIQGHGVYIAVKEAAADQCALVLDGMIVIFAMYLLVNERGGIVENMLLIICGFVAVGWCLAGLILLRTIPRGNAVVSGDRSRAAGMAGGLLAALGVLAALILLGSRNSSGSLAAVIINGFLELLRQVRRGLVWAGALMTRLLSGFSSDEGTAAGAAVSPQSYEETSVDFEPGMIPSWLYILLGVILLALLGLFLFHIFRKMSREDNPVRSDSYRAVVIRREGTAEGAGFWARLRRKWRLYRLRKKNRRTVRGLYDKSERVGRATGFPKKAGESGSAYLKRLAAELSPEAGTAHNALLEISGLLQRDLYSGAQALLPKEKYETLERGLERLGAELKCSHKQKGVV